MKLKSIAFAASALCAVASASAATITINAGGGSATRATTTNVIVASVCGATGINVYRNGSNVTRIICPVSATAGVFSAADTLDFSYDNTTGSYLGVGPVSGNGTLTARVNTASCGAPVAEVIAGKSVTARSSCGNEATLVRPAIGNPDVEPEMFQGANIGVLPAVDFAGIDRFSGQYGVIFGVVVSKKLFDDLQADQFPLNIGSTADEHAPSLSRAQIYSMTTANGGTLNTDWTPLFQGAAPALASTPVRFVRRVTGSGTQTSFNGVMLNYLCSPRGSLPSSAGDSIPGGYTVNEQGSTGNLLTQVASTTAYNIGIASRENAPGAANYRFVKIDGVYPSKANVKAGRYNWMAEQTLTLRAGYNANEEAMFTKLVELTASPSVINSFSAAVQDGTVALPGVADAGDPNYATHATRFRTLGNSCVVPFAVE